MTLQRWEPFSELRRMQEALDRMWTGAWPMRPIGDGVERWGIALDIIDKDKEIEVRASLPDIEPEKVDVTVEDGVLTIKGETSTEKEEREGDYLLKERKAGAFYRAVRLPDSVDSDRAVTKYEKGVLTLTLPKVQPRKAKKIKVNAA